MPRCVCVDVQSSVWAAVALMSESKRGLSFSDSCSTTPRCVALFIYTNVLIRTLIHHDGTSLKDGITELVWVVSCFSCCTLISP